jgi:hypothetical protein
VGEDKLLQQLKPVCRQQKAETAERPRIALGVERINAGQRNGSGNKNLLSADKATAR